MLSSPGFVHFCKDLRYTQNPTKCANALEGRLLGLYLVVSEYYNFGHLGVCVSTTLRDEHRLYQRPNAMNTIGI